MEHVAVEARQTPLEPQGLTLWFAHMRPARRQSGVLAPAV
jgi:hypothetical protein